MNICIYGAASPELAQIYYDKTEELGRQMWMQKEDTCWESLRVSLMNRVFCISIAQNLL